MKISFVMLMGHQIIEFWMLCAINLFFSFKPHKNIRKLIVLFSSLCAFFGLWCEFFAGNIVLWAPLNHFEFGCCPPAFGCISTIIVLKQSKLEAELISLKTYSDVKEDTTLADITRFFIGKPFFCPSLIMLEIRLGFS